MKNQIKAKITFDFKGERFTPQAVIDLDELMESQRDLPDLYLLLATKNHIDSYSYHYEIMLQEEIEFTEATGLAESFCHDLRFDIQAFQIAWKEERLNQMLLEIAKGNLQIDSFEQHPELLQALRAAYEKGRESHQG